MLFKTFFMILILLCFNVVVNSLKYLEFSEIMTDNSQLINLALFKTATSSSSDNSCLITINDRTNYVEYNNKIYSTLSNSLVDSSSVGCDSTYIDLPSGWIIAEDNADTIAVIAAHYWSTHVVVTSGRTFCAKGYSSPGSVYGSGNYLLVSGNSYRSNVCSGRVLIQRLIISSSNLDTKDTLLNAINGDTSFEDSCDHFTAIKFNSSTPTWYMIDLGKSMEFTDIQIWNGYIPSSMAGYELRSGNSPNALDNPICVNRGGFTHRNEGISYYCPAFARYVVIVQTINIGQIGMYFNQIEIYNKPRSDKINVAYMKNVTASTTIYDTCGAKLNVITNGQTGLCHRGNNCFTRSKLTSMVRPWFMIDLGEEINFTDIVIWGSIAASLSNFHILVGNSTNALDNPICQSNVNLASYVPNYAMAGVPFECKSRARYIVIYSQLTHNLELCQVEVYNRPKYYEPLPNLALYKNATQLNDALSYGGADMAVNGYGVKEICTSPYSSYYFARNKAPLTILTNGIRHNWWMVDLGSKQEFTEIVIWGVKYFSDADNLLNFDIRVGNSPNAMDNPIVVRNANMNLIYGYGVKFYVPTSNSRYVVVNSNGVNQLILCQVEVYNRNTIRYDNDLVNKKFQDNKKYRNLALYKDTYQSSYYSCGTGMENSKKAVDGLTLPQFCISDCRYITHTASGLNQWWMVDLGDEMLITNVVVYNTYNANGIRLSNFHIRAGNFSNALDNPICYSNANLYPFVYVLEGASFECDVKNARYVVIHSLLNNYLTISQVEVYDKTIKNSNLFVHKTVNEVKNNLQVFTGSNIKQNYTVPNGVSLLKIWAGGAGGGGGSSTRLDLSAGTGGGAGAVSYATWEVKPGDTIEIKFGPVGKGGTFGDTGSNGGATEIMYGENMNAIKRMYATGGSGGGGGPYGRNEISTISGAFSRVNIIKYNGNVYSTLSDILVDSSTYHCQNYWISLPEGWVVAPDNADVQHVIRSHYWQTSVVLTTGAAWWSLQNPGTRYSATNNYLEISGNSYHSSVCNGQILIMQLKFQKNIDTINGGKCRLEENLRYFDQECVNGGDGGFFSFHNGLDAGGGGGGGIGNSNAPPVASVFGGGSFGGRGAAGSEICGLSNRICLYSYAYQETDIITRNKPPVGSFESCGDNLSAKCNGNHALQFGSGGGGGAALGGDGGNGFMGGGGGGAAGDAMSLHKGGNGGQGFAIFQVLTEPEICPNNIFYYTRDSCIAPSQNLFPGFIKSSLNSHCSNVFQTSDTLCDRCVRDNDDCSTQYCDCNYVGPNIADTPSSQPSSQPSSLPTSQPSSLPTCPTGQPSSQPSDIPSSQPSLQPSNQPTSDPSTQPTSSPSSSPSGKPSGVPSSQPSTQPSCMPTMPTGQPSGTPSTLPTSKPSVLPSTLPTPKPSSQPTMPTADPSESPTADPSESPTADPSESPTADPSEAPV